MPKNKTKNTKGFTIIELLIVLAVIVLLVAIVFISLTIVRTKAGNSVIKNDVDQIRKYAEVMYAENDLRGYCPVPSTNSCFEVGNQRLNSLVEDIKNRSGIVDKDKAVDIQCGGENFCISANLSDNSFYCVDSTGNQTTGDGYPPGSCKKPELPDMLPPHCQ